MAANNSSVLGIPSGKIGNVIVRIRNGKPYYYSVPANFRISKSKAAVRGRKNFATTIALAKTANSTPMLKEIWKNANVPGVNSYQRLIKYNAKRVSDGLLTISNKITPEGLPLKLNSAAVENKKLTLSFECPSSPDLSFPATLQIFLYFGNESGTIIRLFKEISEPAAGGNYTQAIELDAQSRKLLTKDPSPVIFIALAGEMQNRKKVYWTSTASVKL